MSHDDHDSHHVNYLAVFFVLCGFTALSVVFDVLSFENHAITIVLVMAVAVAKALCVMMFFMHLKFEGNWKFILLAPTTILAIGLPLALMPDVALAYYTPTSPQHGEWGEEMKEYRAAHGGEHGHGEESHNTEQEGHSDEHAEAEAAAGDPSE
jgi:cytochrome c oxidase subunit 4